MKFNLGSLVMTVGIDDAIHQDKNYLTELLNCLRKYIKCDWGDLGEYDKRANDIAIKNGDRIFASYKTSKGKVYVITEWDRSCTTLLFANEY